MDSKLAYSEFKFFKNNYVQMNKIDAEYIYISGKLSASEKLYAELSDAEDNMKDYLLVYFKAKSQFYKIYGKIRVTTQFHTWLKDKCIRMTTEDFKVLGNILKKDVIDVDLTSSDVAKFIYTNGEIDLQNSNDFQEELSKNYNLLNNIDFYKFYKDDVKFFTSDEYIELFLHEDGTISKDKTSDKLIEISTGTIKGLYRTGNEKITLHYSERNSLQQRYVLFSSRSDGDDLEINQLFLTI